MSGTWPRLGLAIAWASVWYPAVAASDGACPRDVLVAQSNQKSALEQLEQGGDGPAERCHVWRRHVDTMRRVAAVYARCLTGPERTTRLNQVQGSEKEFDALVRRECKGR